MIKNKKLVVKDIILFEDFRGCRKEEIVKWRIGKICYIDGGYIECQIIDMEKGVEDSAPQIGGKYQVVKEEIECILEPNILGRF